MKNTKNNIETKNNINLQTITAEEANWLSVQIESSGSNENVILDIAKKELIIPKNMSEEAILDLIFKSLDDVNIKDFMGTYLIHWSIFNNNFELTKKLIENNVDINVRNPKGLTPLHFAVQYSNSEIIYLLLNNNVIINTPDFHGNTPLFLAEYNNNIDVYNLLYNINKVENNINISDTKDKNNSSKFYKKNKTIISNILEKRKSIKNNIN